MTTAPRYETGREGRTDGLRDGIDGGEKAQIAGSAADLFQVVGENGLDEGVAEGIDEGRHIDEDQW